MEPSCLKRKKKKLGYVIPILPSEEDRALLGNMTSNRLHLAFSAALLLMCASHAPVVCLVDEKLAVQSATTVAYHSTAMMNGTLTCGNKSRRCVDFCSICNDFYDRATMDCMYGLLHSLCLANFHKAMAALNTTDWCIWHNVSGLYSNLSLCTEEISDCLLIPWPNPLVEQTFVDIHSSFFKNCPMEELSDPPPAIVFALVITPILLIPVMVSLVVLKTKNGDGSS
ncbi:receptor activity-modifying protein 2 isoform X2 [Nerophis lumbriciformis]|uniref:receptor activity-modifying protein 2 isoform X2 n=1 Tax=Nerophis lumbriciformis TaxID=546530 RepID=UPI002ADF356B|nr:receptor activity-modifying protein 2 isoform X2 [Nerophis lumbriciformis]